MIYISSSLKGSARKKETSVPILEGSEESLCVVLWWDVPYELSYGEVSIFQNIVFVPIYIDRLWRPDIDPEPLSFVENTNHDSYYLLDIVAIIFKFEFDMTTYWQIVICCAFDFAGVFLEMHISYLTCFRSVLTASLLGD